MKFRTWLSSLKSPSLNRRSKRDRLNTRKKSACVLTVTSLEDRTVPAFLGPVDYATGGYPNDVVAAHINGDGVLDLATVNYYDSTVSVFLGNGDGTFQDAVISPTGDYPVSVAVGDLDGDGNLDLATANANDVTVQLGDGAGNFGSPAPYFAGYYPNSIAVGDFTGDGKLDLGVTSNQYYGGYYGGGYYGSVNVLVGNGTGGFSGPSTTYLDYGIYASATAVNLDGDIADELVVTDTIYGYGTFVLSSDAFGNLSVSDRLYTGTASDAVGGADVNEDSVVDLVTANGYSSSISVFLGIAGGGFEAAQTYSAADNASSLVIGDFTGDGSLDVAVSDYNASKVNVLYGDGVGGFSNPVSSSTGSYPRNIVSGQFNGDGRLDAATANLGADANGDYHVSILINDGNWAAPPPPPPPTVSIGDVAVTEGNSTTSATFTIYLSKASSVDVTVHYETADGSAAAGKDYTAASGDVIIPAGDTSYQVTIDVLGDRIGESTEDFLVNLSAPVNATLGDDQGFGTIYDDEPTLTIGDMSITEGNTGSANVTFTVYLSQASDVDVKAHYATANDTAGGSDYTAASGDLTIPAGQTSRTFTVAVLGDRAGESNETFRVNLTAPVNAGIADAQAIGTIVDNEPRVSINDVSLKEGNGKAAQMIFTVRLSAAYDQAVTVNFATSSVGGTATAGSDYQSKNGSVTFAPGVTSMTVSITILTDKTKESNETFFVNLSGGSSNYFLFDPQGMGTILDDDGRGK